jgi:hypothetical protein
MAPASRTCIGRWASTLVAFSRREATRPAGHAANQVRARDHLKTAKALGAMVLLVLPSEDHLWIGRHPGQFARLHEDAGMLALGPSCVPAAPQLNREWSLSPEFGWIRTNLCDLSKG